MAGSDVTLRLAFMGSPDFAVPVLRALHDAGHQIAMVYCQPPRPAGRGQAVRRCPVQVAAETLGLAVRTPRSLRHDAVIQEQFAALRLDVAVVAAYGLILPPPILSAPARGCLNVHASLLPRWRGAAPIQAAILAGDSQSGVTIMQMDAGLDTGPMLLREAVPLDATTTAAMLHDTLAELGANLILQALRDPPRPEPQPPDGATYATKLTRADGALDWTMAALLLDRRVRALNPWPGTFTTLDQQPMKVLSARPEAGSGPPGTLLDDQLLVAAGEGALRLTRVQIPGRVAMDAATFLRGHRVMPGARLG